MIPDVRGTQQLRPWHERPGLRLVQIYIVATV